MNGSTLSEFERLPTEGTFASSYVSNLQYFTFQGCLMLSTKITTRVYIRFNISTTLF